MGSPPPHARRAKLSSLFAASLRASSPVRFRPFVYGLQGYTVTPRPANRSLLAGRVKTRNRVWGYAGEGADPAPFIYTQEAK